MFNKSTPDKSIERTEHPVAQFHNHDSLCLLAAAAVVLYHIEQFRVIGVENSTTVHPAIAGLGPEGVKFFFVFSGFLITFLLLAEIHREGESGGLGFLPTKNDANMAVVLRVVLISFLFIPEHLHLKPPAFHILQQCLHKHYWPAFALHVAFLPNFAL